MDSQFNSLLQSYNSNFVQYKVTGVPSYKTSYEAAKQGLDSILTNLQEQVANDKSEISAFYKSGIEESISTLEQKNRKLQRGMLAEADDITAAKIRNQQPVTITPSPSISTTQYITVGILAAIVAGLAAV
jgi:hypothetical protein